MHSGSVTCLSFSDDQLIVSGSSLGSLSMSDLSSDQRIATLNTSGSAGCILCSFTGIFWSSSFGVLILYIFL